MAERLVTAHPSSHPPPSLGWAGTELNNPPSTLGLACNPALDQEWEEAQATAAEGSHLEATQSESLNLGGRYPDLLGPHSKANNLQGVYKALPYLRYLIPNRFARLTLASGRFVSGTTISGPSSPISAVVGRFTTPPDANRCAPAAVEFGS